MARKKSSVRSFTLPDPLSYYLAFLEPPYSTPYTQYDFQQLNKILFPRGIDRLKIYRFNDDFSSYFDAGKEWWGTLFATIYDKALDRYVVICASATD